MHPILQEIASELDQLAAQVAAAVPSGEPFNVAHQNWSFPGLSKADLVIVASSLAVSIRERGQDDLGNNAQSLQDFPRRLQFLRGNMPQNIWGNPALAVPSYMATLEGLRVTLSSALDPDATGQMASADVVKLARRNTARVRSLEASLNQIEPRSARVESMLERIEQAYDAAEQLPTDLQSLAEAKEAIARAVEDSKESQNSISSIMNSITESNARLKSSVEEASVITARLDQAYSAATSQGLAAAFAERSKKLGWSMWIWVVGLISALVVGALIGVYRLQVLIELLKAPGVPESVIALNMLLSLVSIGAPVWFGWLATKQIGQRFRLAEDYAFKASVSKAYEGYRREAARIDSDLETRLLASVLTRLDEQPLRLVEASSYGSPVHELTSSPLIGKAIELVPEFPTIVKNLAKDMLEVRGKDKPKAGSVAIKPPE